MILLTYIKDIPSTNVLLQVKADEGVNPKYIRQWGGGKINGQVIPKQYVELFSNRCKGQVIKTGIHSVAILKLPVSEVFATNENGIDYDTTVGVFATLNGHLEILAFSESEDMQEIYDQVLADSQALIKYDKAVPEYEDPETGELSRVWIGGFS